MIIDSFNLMLTPQCDEKQESIGIVIRVLLPVSIRSCFTICVGVRDCVSVCVSVCVCLFVCVC